MTNSLVPVEQVDIDAAMYIPHAQDGETALEYEKRLLRDLPAILALHRLSHQPTPDSGEDAVLGALSEAAHELEASAPFLPLESQGDMLRAAKKCRAAIAALNEKK